MADRVCDQGHDSGRRGEDRLARQESGGLRTKAGKSTPPRGRSASEEIDAIIKNAPAWKGATLSRLRTLIKEADSGVVEAVKWKKPSNPTGVAVWSHDGIVCFENLLKAAVRLTFPKGAQLEDPRKLFNTRRDSKTVRAIDFHEEDQIDAPALKALIREAVALNGSKSQ